MTTVLNDHRHVKTLGGVDYAFRRPDVYDLPAMRRRLRIARVRRPTIGEYRAIGAEGARRIGEAAGDAAEGARQAEIIERWYDLLLPFDEDSIDEPDLEARAKLFAQEQAERRQEMAKLYPDVLAIEANLDRHCQDWAELRADADFWEEISRIDSVRLLLTEIGGRVFPRDADGLMIEEGYQSIPAQHRLQLGTFALSLLTPDEATRKN
ncbi:hypothetical protein [Sphingobium sp. MI1205]|uniref:hypothetical protein n=1 Tax=Sphingobium sp. MI1205 TaxID=407020 RepID=UPI0007703645|nr:hypothetical protein [Sphingobium sp. MI1205]AMK18698.1 hypothetical protein K663_11595 [Sphingobium sp. MI1205]